jgi:uncharacterized linocin/CFP29 family protein
MITGVGSAPIAPEAWTALEADTRRALEEHLVGRRVVDFDGPHGLGLAALNLGALEPIEVGAGIVAGLRSVLPLVEVRVPFDISRAALEARERGAPDLEDEAAVEAARTLAELEDGAVFQGLDAARIRGLLPTSSHARLFVGADPQATIEAVTRALLVLDEAAVDGPYAVVLGDTPYRRLAAGGDYPPLRRLRELVGDRVMHSRVLTGGVVLSLRGGDFRLTVGQDAALGYVAHTADRVALQLIESFTFSVSSPEAIVALHE